MEKKYICYGDYIISRADGDRHYISARRVQELYRVNPAECFFEDIHENKPELDSRSDLIKLFPRFDGNYDINNLKSDGLLII